MSLSVYEHICFHGFVLVMLCSGTDYLLFPHYNAEQNEKTAVSFYLFQQTDKFENIDKGQLRLGHAF